MQLVEAGSIQLDKVQPQIVNAGSIELDRPDNLDSDLTKSAIVAHNVDADKYAENQRNAIAQGIPSTFATPANKPVNIDDMNNTITDFKSLNGKTAQRMSNIEFAKVAHDDSKSLSKLESVVKFLKRFNDIAYGDYENILNLSTGIVGTTIGAAAGLTTLGLSKAMTGKADVETAKIVHERLANFLTYKPQTETGQTISEDINRPVSILGATPQPILSLPANVGRELIKPVLQSTGAPESIKYPVETVAEFAGYPLVGKLSNIVTGKFANHLENVINYSKESKLRKRDPEAFKSFVEDVAQDQPPVQIPIKAVDDILVAKGLKPEEMFTDSTVYYEAKFFGEKVDMPVSDLAVNSEHFTPENVKDMGTENIPSVNEMEAKIQAKVEADKMNEVSMTNDLASGEKVKKESAKPSQSKESQLAVRAEADAIEKKLTEDFGDLPQYETMSMKEQADRAQKIMDSDYEQAKRMAMGEEKPPEGVREATMYEAVKIRALKEGDVDTIHKLATESSIPSKLSEYGQAIKAADSRLTDDPVRDLQDIAKERTSQTEKTTGKKVKVDLNKIEEIKTKLDNTKVALSGQLAITAKKAAYGSLNKLVKTEEYIALKNDLRKQFGMQINVGIDPTIAIKLGKIGTYHFEAGARSFKNWSARMIQDVGDWVKPHLKEVWDKVKDTVLPDGWKEDLYQKTQKTRLENEIKKLTDKLENNDFTPEEKRKMEMNPEVKKLKEEYDRLKKDYQTIIKSSGTVTKEEVSNLMSLSSLKAELRKKHNPETGWATPQDKAMYGAAAVAYENYVTDLKTGSNTIKGILSDRLKQAQVEFKDNPAKAVLNVGKDVIQTITNNSIAMVATLDNSFLGRQGLKTLMTHPTAWWPGAKNSFIDFAKTIGGQETKNALLADIYSRDNFLNGAYQKAKIIAKSEEQYPATLPERIPVVGRVFKASEQAFTGSALRMRTDLYDMLSKQAKENGVDMAKKENIESLGKLINSLTARGQWGKRGEPAIVRIILWAPKMLKANLDVLTMHGFGAGLENNFTRKQAGLNLLKIVGETAVIMTVANALMPGSAETDPRSSDFGKIKVGDTRFDITGGAASIVTLASRIIPALWGDAATKDTQSGLIIKYGIGYGKRSPFDALIDFLINKTSPPTSAVVFWLKGKNRENNEFTWSDAAYRSFIPISIQNIINLDDDASADQLAGAILDLVGVNANTYRDNSKQTKDIVNRLRKGKELTEEQQNVYDNWSNEKQNNIMKRSELTPMQDVFSTLSVNAMIYAWSKLSENERFELEDIYREKIDRARKKLNGEELDKLNEFIDNAEAGQ